MQPEHLPPKIVVDGREGEEGRALMVLSALHHCAETLAGQPILFADVESSAVAIGVEVLRWETGLEVAYARPGAPVPLQPGCLFAAILCHGLPWPRYSAVLGSGMRTLIAVQFPPLDAEPATLALLAAAHDPRRFADRLIMSVGK
jgi:hypothetical protein